MTQNFKISGIISEFNPYHLGHQSLIVQTRQAGATHIVAIMSGNFVRRRSLPVLINGYVQKQL